MVRTHDPINTVFVGADRCGIAVRSNQHGAYILERQRSRHDYGRTVDCWVSDYFSSRDEAVRAWFSPYAFPGGYSVAFYSLAGNDSRYAGDLDGDVFCGHCALEFYQRQGTQFIRESTDSWEAEARNANTCAHCDQHIDDPQCESCYGDLEPKNVPGGICDNCQKEERGQRYHVIAGISGYMPDYHSADGADDDTGYTLEDAIADAREYIYGPYGLLEVHNATETARIDVSDDGTVYRVDLDPESETRLPWYVEVVEAE